MGGALRVYIIPYHIASHRIASHICCSFFFFQTSSSFLLSFFGFLMESVANELKKK